MGPAGLLARPAPSAGKRTGGAPSWRKAAPVFPSTGLNVGVFHNSEKNLLPMKDRTVKPIEEASATDLTLLLAALDNDQAAWHQLVETYFARVYKWARNAGLQDCDAAEVANEVFASVAKAVPNFHHSAESDTFRGWLRQITQNAVADWWRARQRLPDQAAGGNANFQLLNDVAIAAAISSTRRPEPTPEKSAVEGAGRFATGNLANFLAGDG